MATMKVKDPSVPPGNYKAEFDGVEETHHEQYGDGLLWKFVVTKGRMKGKTAGRTTKPDPTPRNSCGKFLAALAGKGLADGLEIDPEDYEGQSYLISVAETANGSTRVESFIRATVDEEEDEGEVNAGRQPGDKDSPPTGPAGYTEF